ncbi:DEAD/DEAH box helicase [Pedobacter sp. HMWF019]|uniref:DEAD/DEAH box helicase n=1 Tax=Pedobacter sp. HMWF019 TaxID=2056856 RepID=UPI000D3AE8ED|nr:DEAD/DEAH box helicase [Pedobacter sp. HMWF019]PTT03054.1 DEAD/DEAH box helicase [Pedobacter sp. HMWF019]
MFDLLAEPIRKYVRDKRWEALRPIQIAAIQHILTTDKNIILASKTASGKTEAAFLPILSKVFKNPGLRILYISPLIALINDQFNRVEELCDYLEMPVTKWHGEAKRSLKEKLLRNPEGVVLITPESIEAMFVNSPQNVKTLFSNLDFLVIDEIHSFIGTDRGTQLNSLLSRLNDINNNPAGFRVIGLSATIGAFEEAKKMTGKPDQTIVLRDKSTKEMKAEFKFFKMDGADLPIDLLKDLYLKTKDHKVLIFPNSRGKAEEVAVKLKKISDRKQGHPYYFSHHSSIDKELREYIEHFAKNNKRFPFAICCTSTLELGIDIGSVEKVVQIDAASSIASLIQRVGRSGRKDGESSSLLFYATDPWNLLQSIACMELFREGFIEPVHAAEHPYDILSHQILSIIKESSGCSYEALKDRLKGNYAFLNITPAELNEITKELIKKEQIELIGTELIIGIEGERTVNSRDFYSVFKTDPSFKVIHQDKTIGELPLAATIQVDENILLAARIWKIMEVDLKSKKIFVMPAKDGKRPTYFGSGGEVHTTVREKMLQILKENKPYAELDEAANEVLRELRLEFANYEIRGYEKDRPMIMKHSNCTLYTFQGTKINRSIDFLFKLLGIESEYDEHESSFTLKVAETDIRLVLNLAFEKIKTINQSLEDSLRENPALIEFSKWGHLLPIQYQCSLIKAKHFDFDGTKQFLEHIQLISYKKA